MKFEQFDVWHKAVALSCELYQLSEQIDDRGFKDQITRAGLSIPSNIAEGLERESIRDSIKFLGYAKASCGEVYTQLIVGEKIGLLSSESAILLQDKVKHIAAMIGALILKRRRF
jgi:four helix bundle protein